MKQRSKLHKGIKADKKRSDRETVYWILFALAAYLVIMIRLRLLDIPFERDEGDYALNASLLLDGHSLSSPLIIKRFPLIYAIYEFFFTLFGRTDSAIRLGLLLTNLTSGWGLYLMVKQFSKRATGLIAASFFLVLSLLPQILGLSANREHFEVLFALFGFSFLLKIDGKQNHLKAITAGILIGLSFAIKQNAVFWLLFGGIWLLIDLRWYKKHTWIQSILAAFLYSIGIILPFLIIVLLYWQQGVLNEFLAKSVASNASYVAALTWREGLHYLFENGLPIVKSGWMILLLGIVPWFAMFKRENRDRGLVFSCSFFFFSFLAIMPGWYFRPHYFILLIPSISILAAIGFDLSKRLILHRKPGWVRWLNALPFILILQPVYSNRSYFFEANATEAARIAYGHNPFPESKKLGRYIDRITSDTARIMVLGSEPELYFYSKRQPAISAYYMYFLVDGSEAASLKQKKLMEEAEKNPPEFIVFVRASTSWNREENADSTLFNWIDDFILKNNYHLEGVVDILPDKSRYVFGPDAKNYKIRSTGYLLVFKKRDE